MIKPCRTKIVYKGKKFSKKIISFIRSSSDSSIYLYFHINKDGEYRYGKKEILGEFTMAKIKLGDNIVTKEQPKISFHTGSYKKHSRCRIHIRPQDFGKTNRDFKLEVSNYRDHPISLNPEHIMTFYIYDGFEEAKDNERDAIYIKPEKMRDTFVPLIFKVAIHNWLPGNPNSNNWAFRYRNNPNEIFLPVKTSYGTKQYYSFIISEATGKMAQKDDVINMLLIGGWDDKEKSFRKEQFIYLYHISE